MAADSSTPSAMRGAGSGCRSRRDRGVRDYRRPCCWKRRRLPSRECTDGRLQHVDGAEDIDLEVAARTLHGGGHGDLAGEMKNDLGLKSADDGLDIESVADVAMDEFDGVALGGREGAKPVEISRGAVAREIVEDGDLLAASSVSRWAARLLRRIRSRQ